MTKSSSRRIPVRHRRWSPRLIVGGLMLICGLILIAPSTIGRAQQSVTTGRIVDALPRVNDDGWLDIGLLFEFPVVGTLRQPEILGLGFGRCDALGRPLADIRIPSSEWPALWQQLSHDIERGVLFQVFLDPEQPALTARINADGLGLWSHTIGILLCLTPLVLWLARRMRLRASSLVSRSQPGAMNPRP